MESWGRFRAASALGCSLVAFAGGALALPAVAGARGGGLTGSALTPVKGSYSPTSDRSTGLLHRSAMSIELVLAFSHQAQLQRGLAALYNRHSRSYHHWLGRGQFARRFAPSAAERARLSAYLRSRGLRIERSVSPFLLRASGSSAQVEAALATTLRTYRDRRGITYFSNSGAVKLPASLARGVLGVVGLSNTVRLHGSAVPTRRLPVLDQDNVFRGMGVPAPSGSGCEAPYPTTAQLANAVNNGVSFPYGYGAGPGCSGLTPSQTNSIYDAPRVSAAARGNRATFAVFELSAYQPSDIATWTKQFYGVAYHPPLSNVNVDGGPLAPVCPAGDSCQPASQAYAGDIEVDADIENILSVAPSAGKLIVYNAPNDYTGQTELDEYYTIALQDQADSISSSWELCENDAGESYAQAENQLFEFMAYQGQSMFAASGDTGAFGCIRDDGTTPLNVGDPAAQPWVTGVGGTSFNNFNPGQSATAGYPGGEETVWNVDNLCNSSADSENTGDSGYTWCAATGAGNGGSSEFWRMPDFQQGTGVINPYTSYGCTDDGGNANSNPSDPCREVPDISANADEYTPYAEYCTGNASTPGSVCAQIDTSGLVYGWFGIGGTSLSSPLWAGIIGDTDSYVDGRVGNASYYLYYELQHNPSLFFHDITPTGAGAFVNNNGFYPTTTGYDMATGIGSPNMKYLITDSGR
jgi:subtilase family serine protease